MWSPLAPAPSVVDVSGPAGHLGVIRVRSNEPAQAGVCPGVAVNNDIALGLVSDLLKLGLVLCAPLLAVILIIGLLISVLQVVTQVQDPSIAFVPKLVMFVVVLVLLAPWMLGKLTLYGTAMFARLAQ